MTTPSNYSEWVAQVRAGDPIAYAKLYSCVRERIVSRLSLPPHVDPEEVVLDTVSILWKALKRLRDDQKLLSFATTVARRVASKKHRAQRKMFSLQKDPGVIRQDLTSQNLEREELLGTLSSSLKAADRQLFRLLYVSGASSPELQAELGISAEVLRKRKFRLNARLRHIVEGLGR
jgi:RNA polymerase sigma factor (sigma-70 family)